MDEFGLLWLILTGILEAFQVKFAECAHFRCHRRALILNTSRNHYGNTILTEMVAILKFFGN